MTATVQILSEDISQKPHNNSANIRFIWSCKRKCRSNYFTEQDLKGHSWKNRKIPSGYRVTQ